MALNVNIFSIHWILGFTRIVQVLIERGANLNAVNENNDSALNIAAFKGKVVFPNPIEFILNENDRSALGLGG